MLRVTFLAVALFFVSSSVLQMRAFLQERHSEELSDEARRNPTIASTRAELEATRHASALPLAAAGATEQLFWTNRRLAGLTDKVDHQIILYCQALSAIGSAMKKAPLNSLYLMYWADMRQLLDNIDCKLPDTEGEVREIAKFAQELDPSNPTVAYMSGVVFSFLGERENANAQFRKILSYPVSLNSLRKKTILNHMSSAEELESIVPPRFPQVIEWGELLKNERNFDYQRWRPSLTRLQLAALDDAKKRFQEAELSFRKYEYYLSRLASFSDDDNLRKRLDLEFEWAYRLSIARQRYSEAAKISEYFTLRSRVDKLVFTTGVRPNDTRPKRSTLAYWNEEGSLQFNQFEQSLGFFLAENQLLNLIELDFPQNEAPNPDSVQLLVSEDNRTWMEFPGLSKLRSLDFLNRGIVSFQIAPSYYPFWKIHIPRKLDDDFFQFQTRSLVRAYGRSLSVARSDNSGDGGVK